jgi:hypothetical protein
MSTTATAGVASWCTAALQAVQATTMTTTEVAAKIASARATHVPATASRTAHAHAAVPMKVMTKVAAMGTLAVAVPQVFGARSRVIASARSVDVARVLVLAVPGRGCDRGAVISGDGLLMSPLADVGVTNDGRSCGSRYRSLLPHAVYPGMSGGEDLSPRGTAAHRRRTVGLGSAGSVCQARGCENRSR